MYTNGINFISIGQYLSHDSHYVTNNEIFGTDDSGLFYSAVGTVENNEITSIDKETIERVFDGSPKANTSE